MNTFSKLYKSLNIGPDSILTDIRNKKMTGQIFTHDEIEKGFTINHQSNVNMYIQIFPTTCLPQNMNYVRWKSYKPKVALIVINKRQYNTLYVCGNPSKCGKTGNNGLEELALQIID